MTAHLQALRRPRRRQEGVTVVLVALLLTGLCGMAALAVDVGVLLGAKNEAQNAADAAALAGAFTFLQAPSSAQPGAAQNAAVAIGNTNLVLNQQLTLSAADVSVDEASREVTVTVNRSGANAVPTFFARVLGINSAGVMATATAQASPYASGSICLRPIFVPNTILSSESPAQACSDGQTILGSNGLPSPWLLANPQLMGSLYTIRPTSPSGALLPSQFYSLDFGGGGSTYSCTLGSNILEDCYVSPAVASCGSSYPTENGNMMGPTQQGIGNLLGATPDTWVGLGAYESAGGTITDTSNQLIVAPVWDNCNYPITSGKQLVTVMGYSQWFIDGWTNAGGGGVQANFVNAAGCAGLGGGGGGGGGGGNGNNGTGQNSPFGMPVQLVNPGN